MTLALSIDTNLDINIAPSKIFSECMTSLPPYSPFRRSVMFVHV